MNVSDEGTQGIHDVVITCVPTESICRGWNLKSVWCSNFIELDLQMVVNIILGVETQTCRTEHV